MVDYKAALLALALLAVLSPTVALASTASGVNITVPQSPDGWSSVVKPLDALYGSLEVDARYPQHAAAALAPKPLLAAFTPDPVLWERLSKLPLAAPEASPRVLVDTVAGEPVLLVSAPSGSSVRVRLAEPQPVPRGGDTPDMVIVYAPGLRGAAEEIARLHRERQGLKVQLMSIGDVVREYHVGDAWGLLEGLPGACPRGRVPKGYNATAAAALVELARSLAGRGVSYLLLLGGARDVPPVYYCSPILSELVSKDEGVVPSDYYYSDPDGDNVAELAVGRLPFTSSVDAERYAEALRRWMDGGLWQQQALVSGGAPFAYTLLTGEAAAAQASRRLAALNVTVDHLLLSLGGYEGTRLTGYLGRYGLYYIVAHGSGSALLDYIPGGLWNYDFDEKLYSSDIGYGLDPGVFLLPACRDGYWDTDLVRPPFRPPSLAQALLSRGAAVAYIGFARIAIEVIDAVHLDSGRMSLGLAAADRLLLEYLSALRGADTLGRAWARALTSYAALPAAGYRAYLLTGEERIGDLVLHEAVFLGDPAAPNPWSSGGRGEPHAPPARIPGGTSLGAPLLAQLLARYSAGTMPAAKPLPGGLVEILIDGQCPSRIESHGLARAYGMLLTGLPSDEVVEAREENGTCRVVVKVRPESPGLHVLTAVYPDGVVTHYYYIAAGVVADTVNETVSIYGLDLLSVLGPEPVALVSGGETVALVPADARGLVLPLDCCSGSIEARPVYGYAWSHGGPLVAREYEKLLGLYKAVLPGDSGGGGGGSLRVPGYAFAAAAPALGLLTLAGWRRRARATGSGGEAPGYIM